VPSVETVRGPVPLESLGATLPHEHVFLKNPEIDQNYPDPEWDEEVYVQKAVDALDGLAARGVTTIVDLTVQGLGRYIPRIQRVAAATSVNIVVATGSYTFSELPSYYEHRGPGRLVEAPRDPLETFFIRDLTEGIAGTGVKAAVIKVATDAPGITPDVERVLRAAAVAHHETGATITTHTHAASFAGRDQQALLRSAGVPLEHVVIGHCGESTDLGYLTELMDNGSTIGLDRFGVDLMLPDPSRIDVLVALVEMGYADRLTISHDAFVYSVDVPPSWCEKNIPNCHYGHISAHILPAIRERGVPEDVIHQIMVTNPARILAGAR
jgi:phosphotriesterase-related protein